MATLGADLQHARELAGLSLDDLSARTKIRRPLLEAIERDDFAAVPGGLLARGYLRAYAREVGLPADPITTRYQSEFAPAAPPLTEAFKGRAEAWSLSQPDRSHGSLAVVILIALFGIWFVVDQRGRQDDAPQAVGTMGHTPVDPAAVVPDAQVVSRTGVTQGVTGLLLTVEINPTRVVWVEATADGKRILYALVTPEQRPVIEARQEFLLRVGDAGAFRYLVNGVQGREVGGPGEVREVRITRQNYSTFQKP